MADLRCPNCGRNNPDFLDACQFCQTPLRDESTLHIGESPVKKNTGELEPILPQWLKDVRQQARESAAEDAAEEAAKPKVRNEPPDLLAGLASQARNDREEIPDWLSGINPLTKPTTAEPAAPPPVSDFFAQFEKSEPAQAAPQFDEPVQDEVPSWMTGSPESTQSESKDELTEWFAKASAEESKPIEIESDEMSWGNQAGVSPIAFKEPEPPKENEDLGWLHALEDSTKQPEVPSAPVADTGWSPAESQSSSQEDLSWLNQLGGGTEFKFHEPAPSQTAESKPESMGEDLSWLNTLGGQEVTSFEEKPAENNLDWLKGTGEETIVNQAPAESVSPFTKTPTGQLDGADAVPDWLKSATEEPAMPAPGALSDWFKDDDAAAHSPLQPVPIDPAFIPAPMDSPSLSSQDVDSLFSVDMPDWVADSKTGAGEGETQQQATPSSALDDSLAPVDLPSWVQAMRPVESVISDAPSVEGQPTEREGPLAGLRGVIPIAPIGSSRRPKAISLKLQASDEQQSAAEILEQVLAAETNPRPLRTSSIVASQQKLRWALTGLMLVVLGVMLFLNTQSMPISASLPIPVNNASNAVVSLPPNSSVLIVIDYEPALAGEMEAVSGPLLDQLALSGHPRLSFVSTSANGSALVSRLLTNTRISLPAPNGLDYKAGVDYFNLGYLPGGSSGVLEFVELPNSAIPNVNTANVFSEFAAVVVLTDHAESGRVWVEQLDVRKQIDPSLANQPLIVVASAQAGPLLQPYVSSGQITGMVSGLSDAARYEYVNNSRPGLARRYWDSFGVGVLLAILLITLGGLWSLVSGIRARRLEAEFG